MSERFDLDRFMSAQTSAYDAALGEIRAGRKRSHWMWFVFPQIAGLGNSPTAQHYAIRSLAETQAYLAHPVLGSRYLEIVGALQDLTGGTAEAVFGGIDALKLRSSLTLFEAAGAPPIVAAAIERWCGGVRDARTLAMIEVR